jgi:hypothetical protein
LAWSFSVVVRLAATARLVVRAVAVAIVGTLSLGHGRRAEHGGYG